MNDDTISRQAAIDAVSWGCQEFRGIFARCEKNLNALPSAERKGKWIFNPRDGIEAMFTKPKCSICGFESADGFNYCPNCGAKMEEE